MKLEVFLPRHAPSSTEVSIIGRNTPDVNMIMGPVGPQAKLSAEPPSGQALEVELKGESIPARLDRLGLIAGDRAEVPAGSNVPPGTLLAPDSSWNG